MIRTAASDLVNEALRTAGMAGSGALSWLTKITLLNNAYQQLYYNIARRANRPFVRSFVTSVDTFKVPRDLQQIYAIRPYISEEEWSGVKLQPIEETGEDSHGKYILRNNTIKINMSGGPWLVEYIPTPDTLLFVAGLLPLDTIPLYAEFIRMDDEVIIYSLTDADTTTYYAYNINKATTTETVEVPVLTTYMEWTGLRAQAGRLFTDDGEITDYFVDPDKVMLSFVVAGPYLYINYTDGTVDGYEGMKHFVYNPFIAESNNHNIEVMVGWTNDQTGYGLVVKETKLTSTKLWLAGFTEDSIIDYPINIHWDYLTTTLALNMQQANGEYNEALARRHQQASLAFESMLTRDQAPGKIRRTKDYR